MYLLTDDPVIALDAWEKWGIRCCILASAENTDFVDSTFSRVENVEQFFDLVRRDYALFEGQRENPQKEASDALYSSRDQTNARPEDSEAEL